MRIGKGKALRRGFTALFCLWGGLAQASPFGASAADLVLEPGEEGAVEISFSIPAGTQIYRDRVEVMVLDNGGLAVGAPQLPPGVLGIDSVTGLDREIYESGTPPLLLPVGPVTGEVELAVRVSWQGCQGSVCYLPEQVDLHPRVRVSEAGGQGEDTPSDPVQVEVGSELDKLLVTFTQQPEWHLTQSMTSLRLDDGQEIRLGEQGWPEAHQRPDPALPGSMRGEYDGSFTVETPLLGPRSIQRLSGVVTWQACKAERCLLPRHEPFQLEVQLSGAQDLQLPGTAEVPEVDFSGLPESAAFRGIDADDKPHRVHARLLADRDTVRPGDTFRLGVHLDQDEHWHTYWLSPGDIGLATRIEWILPQGWSHGDVEFPLPERFDQQGIVSYGYDDQVLFFTQVTVGPEAAPGAVDLGASASWLVCEVECINGAADLSLPMEVVAGGEPARNDFGLFFDHFASRHPTHPTEVEAFRVETALSASAIRLGEVFRVAIKLTPTGEDPILLPRHEGNWPGFAPIVNTDWMFPSETRVSVTEDGGVLVVLEGESFELEALPTQQRIGGLFQVKVGDTWVRTQVTTDVPIVAAEVETVASTSPFFSGPLAQPPGEADGPAPVESPTESRSFGFMLLLAFLGGMLLNIMPCVLPVLTLKLYSLVEQADISQGERRVAGLAYSAGVVGSFLVLAAVLVAVQASLGGNVGWGFQFQYPPYVIALATVVFVFGLSLFGVFDVPVIGANQAASASQGEGVAGYLLTGAFATLLATPCSAPFLGTGMGFAFSLPPWGILLFFGAAGLGLAAPFLVIAFVPALFSILPRPGAWMETFKQFMGFTLMATTVWLADVIASQTGREGSTGFLIFLLFVSLGAWIFGRWGGLAATGRRQLTALTVGLLLAGVAGKRFLVFELAQAEVPQSGVSTDLDFSEEIPWQPFSDENVASLAGHTLFVDFTADWCLTCKVNERTVLAQASVRQAMERLEVVPLKADYTRRDPEIGQWLKRFGKAGVPFYLVIPGDISQAPIAMPEFITPSSVVEALERGAGVASL